LFIGVVSFFVTLWELVEPQWGLDTRNMKRRQEELLEERPQQRQGVKKIEALLKEGLVYIIGAFMFCF
jgi:hypothetical protein